MVETRDHDLTVAATFRALTTERHRLPSFQAEPRVSAKIAHQVDEVRNHRPGPAGVTAG